MSIIKKTISSANNALSASVSPASPVNPLAALVALAVPTEASQVYAEGARVALELVNAEKSADAIKSKAGQSATRLLSVHIAEGTQQDYGDGFINAMSASDSIAKSTRGQYVSHMRFLVEHPNDAMPCLVSTSSNNKGQFKNLQTAYRATKKAVDARNGIVYERKIPQWLVSIKQAITLLEADDFQRAYDVLCEVVESHEPEPKAPAEPKAKATVKASKKH